MTAARRAARRERQAAELLGTRRVLRGRFDSAPDVEPVTLPCGVRLVVEVKTRAKLPALVTGALAQAAGYGARGDVAAAVLSATGAEPVIVLAVRAFRRIAGIPSPAADGGSGRAIVAPGAVASLDGADAPTGGMRGARAALDTTLADLGDDELAVLGALARRLLEGSRRYGALDLAGDRRDWRRERAEELADALVYGAFAEVAAMLVSAPANAHARHGVPT
jgi:hypothetical protein